MSEDAVVKVCRRIMKASEEGRGVRLSAYECRLMALDTAIAQVVWTYDEEEDDREEREKEEADG